MARDDTTVTVRLTPDAPCRLLIVDDDELIRMQLAALLRHAGYDVCAVASGEEALRALEIEFYPIIVTDWEMPDMDGIALCRNLRTRQGDAYIYILLLTIRDHKRDVIQGLKAGADDYIVKGSPSQEFLARIDTGRRIVSLEQSLRSANRENRRLAVTDALTGARNRRYLMKYLPRELERCHRYGHPVALLAFDIDYFKKINDTFGHDAGDDVLQAIVARVSGALRVSSDWIARSGGEEFVVVLPETSLHGATIVGDKLRQVVAAAPLATRAGPITVTISVGASACEAARGEAACGAGDLLRAADRCLYASKEGGRDRTTAAAAAREQAAQTRPGAGSTHPHGREVG